MCIIWIVTVVAFVYFCRARALSRVVRCFAFSLRYCLLVGSFAPYAHTRATIAIVVFPTYSLARSCRSVCVHLSLLFDGGGGDGGVVVARKSYTTSCCAVTAAAYIRSLSLSLSGARPEHRRVYAPIGREQANERAYCFAATAKSSHGAVKRKGSQSPNPHM